MIQVIFLVLLTVTNSAEVDFLNILLPQLQESIPTFPVQLVTAQDGCYHWISSQPEWIHIQSHLPKSPGCSRQALVSVNKVGPFPSSIFVSADEANSQSQMKIPVRIRKVSKITIASKSRMMNIKEVQRLELLAFDNDANTFTSLEGLRFKWKLIQGNSILEVVPLANAKLFLPLKIRQNIEKSGYQSDMIVVKALAPGNLKVTATCIEPGYQHLTDQITISVHEKFELKPGPIVRMAPETSIQLALFRPTGQQILVPQEYYKIISCDGFKINSTLYLTVPNRPGRCTIKVQDTRTIPTCNSSSQIIVDFADDIRIFTSPLIIVGKQSPYQVQLLREGMSLLGHSKNIKVKSDFQIDQSREMVVARKKMTGIISAQLGNLKKDLVINSFLPVTVILPDNYLHLPVGQYFKLKILGGTGDYDFQINHEIASISSIHVLHARSVGDITVTVKDRNHLSNTATFRLKVSDLSEIYSLDAQKEVNRDEWGKLYVIGKNQIHQTFTQCNNSVSFTFQVPSTRLDFDKKVNLLEEFRKLESYPSPLVQEVLSETSLLKGKHQKIIKNYELYVLYNEIEANQLIQYVTNLENYGICKIIKFKSIITLDQMASISLDSQDLISTRVPLRVYNYITTTIRGEDHQFLLTPESSLKWTYTGGSYPWKNSQTNAQINNKQVSQGSSPIITCPSEEIPSKIYQLRVFNTHTKRLLFPTEQKINITIICKFPKKLHLQLEHGQAFDEIFIESQRQIKGNVEASDQFNQIFYNSSNVVYQFSPISGSISHDYQHFTYRDKGMNDTITILTEQLSSGLRFKRVSKIISINIVPPVIVDHPLAPQDGSKNITIYTLFTPKKPYIIKVHDLHSQIQVYCSKAVSCQRGQNYIAVKYLKIGTGYVTIKDKKMYGSQTWNFQFIIVEADDVKIQGDRDYAQEGDNVKLVIQNHHNNKLISHHTYEPSYLQLILSRNLRVVSQNGNQFIVKAQVAGEYQIFAQNTYPRNIRSQNPFILNVYKQLQPNIEQVSTTTDEGFLMIEGKIASLVGCRRLIRILGGPKQMTLSYHSQSQKIQITSKDSRTFQISSSSQGKYQVVITVNYKHNKIAIIMVSITVSRIQSIQLQSIEQPVVGSHFRIYPKFKIEDHDLSDSSCDFHYQWSSGNDKVKIGQSRSFGFIDAAGVNATAKKKGSQVINLEVLDKSSNQILKKVSKYLQVIEDINLFFPTYIQRDPCCPPTSIIMPPSSKYSFDHLWSASSQSSLVTVAQNRNVIESHKKIGHTTIIVTREGHRPLLIHVQVRPINGVFIGNHEGYLSIDNYHEKHIPIYLQDNNGRLMINPLQNIDISAYSSNTEMVQVKMNSEMNELKIKSKARQGVCIISVILPGGNLMDSIVVSVGSAISPGKIVNVLAGGSVQFSSVSNNQKWISSNPQIAQIDQKSGLLQARKHGSTIISYGQLQSKLDVLKISSVKQVGSERYKGSSVEIVFQAQWTTRQGIEQLPSFIDNPSIQNNFNPSCEANNRYLNSKIEKYSENGLQRFLCTISPQDGYKIPESISVTVKDGTEKIKSFNYDIKPHFSLDRYIYNLSPSKPKATIDIKTNSIIKVMQRNGRSEWIQSNFIEKHSLHTIKVDMSGQQNDLTWWLELSCEGQKQQVTMIFETKGKDRQSPSFWSWNFDWPDYLIFTMAIVFGIICYIQYSNEEKRKSS